jgi:Flp pilus assembly protein TadG
MSPRRRTERAAMSLEMVVLTPVLVGCILTIAAGARFVEAADQVDAAAAVAARAASLEANAATASAAGESAAYRALTDRGRSCVRLEVRVDPDAFEAGGVVRATVTCHADLSDLAGFGLPGSRSFTATSVVPLEAHRVIP